MNTIFCHVFAPPPSLYYMPFSVRIHVRQLRASFVSAEEREERLERRRIVERQRARERRATEDSARERRTTERAVQRLATRRQREREHDVYIVFRRKILM